MPVRTALVAGNWKMNLTAPQGVQLVQFIDDYQRGKLRDDLKLSRGESPAVDVVVAPPFTAIHSASTVISIDKMNIGLAAQDMFWEAEGAFTGEVSPTQLKAARVGYVILGHSERREYFNETNEVVNKKVKAAIEHGLVPILCCGESLETREAGNTLDFIDTQIREGLAGVSAPQAADLVIAYEPIWAIGTGKTATPAMADEVCGHIRKILGELFGPAIRGNARILYGGSVNAGNADYFFAEDNIDGALVGGASLKAGDFNPIIKAAAQS